MARTKLDSIDQKILKRLQEEGRVTNVELAKSVGISAPPCLRRVRALEDAGYIEGYHAKLNHSALGYGVTVFAMVKLKSQAEEDLNAFSTFIMKLPFVRDCHLLAGEVDFILKIVAKDWDAYQEIFTNELSKAPNVNSIKSSLAIRTLKNKAGIPL